MRIWPARKQTLSLGVVEELVRREVERVLEVELAAMPILVPARNFAELREGSPVLTPTVTTRKSKLTTALGQLLPPLVRVLLAEVVRLCATCGQPFLVPRGTSALSDPYDPCPTSETRCQAHRQP